MNKLKDILSDSSWVNCSNVPLLNEKAITNTSLKTQNLFDKGTKTTEASRKNRQKSACSKKPKILKERRCFYVAAISDEKSKILLSM